MLLISVNVKLNFTTYPVTLNMLFSFSLKPWFVRCPLDHWVCVKLRRKGYRTSVEIVMYALY
jgi:hypothetical protein